MQRKIIIALVLLSGLSVVSTRGVTSQSPNYVVTQRCTLRKSVNGIDGTLVLLLDQRLSKPIRKELWGKGDWTYVFSPDSTLFKQFSALAPGKAKLKIRNDTGRVIAECYLRTPLARLEAWNPASNANQAFLVTEDYSAGLGSFSGLVTIILRISDGTFQNVKAIGAVSHKAEPIRLMKSLKSDWRIVNRHETGGEILSISCHPENNGKFVVEYVRYVTEGNRWLKYEREAKGFWESGNPFPSRSAFP